MQQATTTAAHRRATTWWLLVLGAAACICGGIQVVQGRRGRAVAIAARSSSGSRTVAARPIRSVPVPRDVAAELRAALSPGVDRAQAIAIFAAHADDDPVEALAIAASVEDAAFARELRDAVLRRWAKLDTEAAANWSMKLPVDEQIAAIDAVFAGAAATPGAAMRVGSRLCAEHPELAPEIGHSLEAALTSAKQFSAAVDFASASAAPDAPLWLSGAVYQWAAHNPEAALRAVAGIRDAAVQENAYRQAISSWANGDPASVAAFASRIPAGPARDEAFYIALPKWAQKDPAAAAEWLTAMKADHDFDSGIAAVALGSRIAQINPEVAVGLAEEISDGAVRSAALRMIGENWRARDPAQAAAYLSHAAGFRPDDLAALTGSADATD